jgi:hypothetical protein
MIQIQSIGHDIHRLLDNSIDFDFYGTRATTLRGQALQDDSPLKSAYVGFSSDDRDSRSLPACRVVASAHTEDAVAHSKVCSCILAIIAAMHAVSIAVSIAGIAVLLSVLPANASRIGRGDIIATYLNNHITNAPRTSGKLWCQKPSCPVVHSASFYSVAANIASPKT